MKIPTEIIREVMALIPESREENKGPLAAIVLSYVFEKNKRLIIEESKAIIATAFKDLI